MRVSTTVLAFVAITMAAIGLRSGHSESRSIQLSVETVATLPFVEDFEASAPLATYWRVSGTEQARTEGTTDYVPHGGLRHLIMDDTTGDAIYSRNELTLSINLAGFENVVLTFWAKSFSDEPDGPPAAPFIGGADFDGVAISADGNTWYEVQSLRSLSASYTQFVVNLDAAIAQYGLSYNSAFRIRFNHFDNYPISSDGFAFDDISIAGTAVDCLRVDPRADFFSHGPVGGPFDPPGKTYTLRNTCLTTLSWTAAVTQPWLDISPTSGTLAGGTTTTVAVNLNAYAAGLPMGWHTDSLTFTNQTSGNSRTFSARLVVANPAQWTFLVYLDGDNDLEPFAVTDFLEMAAVGSNTSLYIVTLFDRSPLYDTTYGDWSNTRRGLIRRGDIPNASWGENVGELNMGNPQTLIDFVRWGMENYPATSYALVLWNHGSGWRESIRQFPIKIICIDETDADALFTAEVGSAMAAIEAAVGEADVLGFDACLMSMVEVAYEVRDSARFMVASEETIPGDGWPYDLIVADLATTPSMNARELAARIVERYYESYGDNEVLSVTDLAQMNILAAEIDSFAQTLRENWDLDYTACTTAALEVMAAINTAVIHERHGPWWPGSHGLAIYFPQYSDSFSPDYNGTVITFARDTRWDQLLLDYYTSMTDSWLAEARAQTQFYAYPEHIDLYDFCENLIASVPDDLLLVPESDFVTAGPQGGPFTPPCKTYTLTNTARNRSIGRLHGRKRGST